MTIYMDKYEVKGSELENQVKETLEEIFEGSSCEVLKGPKIRGCSGSMWRPDFAIIEKSNNGFVAIIECKGVGLPKSWQYHAQMCEAYIELNDLRLGPQSPSAKYYLIVNRPQEVADRRASKINYKTMFNCINVKLYYWTELDKEDWQSFNDEFFQMR